MLADWLGSDDAPDCFPFANGTCPDRMAFARERAARVLEKAGLAAEPVRQRLRSDPPDFRSAFGNEPRPLQAEVARLDALCVVLESETGSGKTEAALWRFLDLFRRGLVDGIYVALPMRVAATQIFDRVRLFAIGFSARAQHPLSFAPSRVRLAPMQRKAIRCPSSVLSGTMTRATASARARWAAEHPKRFLATQIAVGTIRRCSRPSTYGTRICAHGAAPAFAGRR
jgi:CRISPR-associated endonuclease/helicase Cas3